MKKESTVIGIVLRSVTSHKHFTGSFKDTGLKITDGQRTKTIQNDNLFGENFCLPVILTGYILMALKMIADDQKNKQIT